MQVGFIGLGNIGQPMARRLLAGGYELTVHNRSQAAVEALVQLGARRAGNPREVAESADVVCTALPFPVTVDAIYLGPDGLCQHARPGQILIDHSTVSPATSRRIAEAARTAGAEALDAPVSGGPEAAARGSLAIMVGGEVATFERVRSLLALLGTNVRLCGPSGAGATLKLINQVLVTIHSVAAAEALSLARAAGVDPELALEMLMAGLAASGILDRNGNRILARDFTAGARIDLMVKDAALAREQCDSLGLELPVFFRARASFERALELGYGHEDLAGVVRTLEPRPVASASG
jgi:3-hydroxyisobutyrate dehydrogenase-like beta-hydroxyacid dehydrogenase